jgi:hypothetical protein
MQVITTRACVMCAGEPDRDEDLELRLHERPQEVRAMVLSRTDPPPAVLVKGRICQNCYDTLLALPRA